MTENEQDYETLRKLVIQLLGISNPDETIEGACRNKMQIVQTLAENAKEDEAKINQLTETLEYIMWYTEGALSTTGDPDPVDLLDMQIINKQAVEALEFQGF